MLATLIDAPFDDRDWVFETKWDGFRLVAKKPKAEMHSLTRVIAPQLSSIFRGFASSTFGRVSLRTPSLSSAAILFWSILLDSWKFLA